MVFLVALRGSGGKFEIPPGAFSFAGVFFLARQKENAEPRLRLQKTHRISEDPEYTVRLCYPKLSRAQIAVAGNGDGVAQEGRLRLEQAVEKVLVPGQDLPQVPDQLAGVADVLCRHAVGVQA